MLTNRNTVYSHEMSFWFFLPGAVLLFITLDAVVSSDGNNALQIVGHTGQRSDGPRVTKHDPLPYCHIYYLQLIILLYAQSILRVLLTIVLWSFTTLRFVVVGTSAHFIVY